MAGDDPVVTARQGLDMLNGKLDHLVPRLLAKDQRIEQDRAAQIKHYEHVAKCDGCPDCLYSGPPVAGG